MVIIDSAVKLRELFCGKSLPWTMVTSGHKARVNFTISPYANYQASCFYSSYKPHWFDSFAAIHKLNVKSSFVSHLNYFPVFKRLEMDVIKYYLISDPWQVLLIGVSWNVSVGSRTRLVIHDGPGHLSDILVKYTEKSDNKKYYVRSRAFSAMVQITNLQNDTNDVGS